MYAQCMQMCCRVCMYMYTCVYRKEVNLRCHYSDSHPVWLLRKGLSLAWKLLSRLDCLSSERWLHLHHQCVHHERVCITGMCASQECVHHRSMCVHSRSVCTSQECVCASQECAAMLSFFTWILRIRPRTLHFQEKYFIKWATVPPSRPILIRWLFCWVWVFAVWILTPSQIYGLKIHTFSHSECNHFLLTVSFSGKTVSVQCNPFAHLKNFVICALRIIF